jgi:hypothetical protein
MMSMYCMFFSFIVVLCQFADGFRFNNPLLTFRGRNQKLRFSQGGSLKDMQRKKDISLRDQNNQFDNHSSVAGIPDSLVKSIDGNDSMRKKFEQLCRRSQVSLSCPFSGFLSLYSLVCLLTVLGFYL